MKYIVEIRENGKWMDIGEGPLTELQAARIQREIVKGSRGFATARITPLDTEQTGAQGMEDACGING